jgi:predicted peptidase
MFPNPIEVRMKHLMSILLVTMFVTIATGCGSNPAGAVNRAAPSGTGMMVRSIQFAGDSEKYSVFIPPTYDAKKSYPTIIFLSGLFEGGDDGVTQTTVGIGPQIAKRPERFKDFIVVFPQSDSGNWNSQSHHDLAWATFEDVARSYSVDRSRVIVTGLSTGGLGTWQMAAKYPDRIAAIVPMAAQADQDLAPKLVNMPIWAFHNGGDILPPASSTKGMIKAIKRAGGDPKMTIYGGLGHNCWNSAYSESELFTWMKSQKLRGAK